MISVPPKTSSATSTSSTTTTILITTPTTTSVTTEPETPEPVDPNPCILSPEKGYPGLMTVSMWYYDQTSMTCSPFMYLGKGGNSNRFETSEECMDTCAIGKPTRKSCELPPAIGNGPFNIPRYYFDKVTKRCERFFYSGRDGNDNRFYKKNKCERLCLRSQLSTCKIWKQVKWNSEKPKKKENIFEFTTTPSMPPVIYESTPMRIIQNLVPIRTMMTTTTTTTSAPISTETRMNTDPYSKSDQNSIRSLNSFKSSRLLLLHGSFQSLWNHGSKCALKPRRMRSSIAQPRTQHWSMNQEEVFENALFSRMISVTPETLPSIVPPSSTPSIADHVFASLMNTQQRKLVELVQAPVQETSTVGVPRKFSSHERIPFGQVEQQPVPLSPYGSAKPTENQYGMKVSDRVRAPAFNIAFFLGGTVSRNRLHPAPLPSFNLSPTASISRSKQ